MIRTRNEENNRSSFKHLLLPSHIITFLIAPFLCLTALSSCGQKGIERAITDNTYPVSSLTSQDNADLLPLARAIGNSRVVMLGEQDHGDATTFEAKTRLVKFLHQQLGFDAIVFESDFFALDNHWAQVKSPEDVGHLIEDNIFAIWTQCQQFTPLKEYLQECYGNGKALQIAGMDNQLHGLYSQNHFPEWFIDFLHTNNIETIPKDEINTTFKPFLDSLMHHSRRQTSVADTLLLKKFQGNLQQIRQQLLQKGWSDEYEMQVLSSFEAQVFMMLTRNRTNVMEGAQLRDKQMAENLHWLLTNRFKNKKVIVWAASAHIFKTVFEPVPKLSPTRYYPMGYHFTRLDSSNAVYALGFSSYQGSSRRVKRQPYTFASTASNSLEAWANKEDLDYAFIDLDKVSASVGRNEPFLMSGAGHIQTKQNWMEGFNGVFYIRNMKPCTFAE